MMASAKKRARPVAKAGTKTMSDGNIDLTPESPLAGSIRAVEKAERKLKEAMQSLRTAVHDADDTVDAKELAAAERLIARR